MYAKMLDVSMNRKDPFNPNNSKLYSIVSYKKFQFS